MHGFLVYDLLSPAIVSIHFLQVSGIYGQLGDGALLNMQQLPDGFLPSKWGRCWLNIVIAFLSPCLQVVSLWLGKLVELSPKIWMIQFKEQNKLLVEVSL